MAKAPLQENMDIDMSIDEVYKKVFGYIQGNNHQELLRYSILVSYKLEKEALSPLHKAGILHELALGFKKLEDHNHSKHFAENCTKLLQDVLVDPKSSYNDLKAINRLAKQGDQEAQARYKILLDKANSLLNDNNSNNDSILLFQSQFNALINLGKIYIGQKTLEPAFECYEKALNTAKMTKNIGAQGHANYELALAYLAKGANDSLVSAKKKFDEAVEDWTKSNHDFADEASVFNKALASLLRNEVQPFVQDYTKEININTLVRYIDEYKMLDQFVNTKDASYVKLAKEIATHVIDVYSNQNYLDALHSPMIVQLINSCGALDAEPVLEVVRMVFKFQKQGGKLDGEMLNALQKFGFDSYDKGDMSAALMYLEIISGAQPNNEVLARISDAHLNRGDYDAALKYANEVLRTPLGEESSNTNLSYKYSFSCHARAQVNKIICQVHEMWLLPLNSNRASITGEIFSSINALFQIENTLMQYAKHSIGDSLGVHDLLPIGGGFDVPSDNESKESLAEILYSYGAFLCSKRDDRAEDLVGAIKCCKSALNIWNSLGLKHPSAQKAAEIVKGATDSIRGFMHEGGLYPLVVIDGVSANQFGIQTHNQAEKIYNDYKQKMEKPVSKVHSNHKQQDLLERSISDHVNNHLKGIGNSKNIKEDLFNSMSKDIQLQNNIKLLCGELKPEQVKINMMDRCIPAFAKLLDKMAKGEDPIQAIKLYTIAAKQLKIIVDNNKARADVKADAKKDLDSIQVSIAVSFDKTKGLLEKEISNSVAESLKAIGNSKNIKEDLFNSMSNNAKLKGDIKLLCEIAEPSTIKMGMMDRCIPAFAKLLNEVATGENQVQAAKLRKIAIGKLNIVVNNAKIPAIQQAAKKDIADIEMLFPKVEVVEEKKEYDIYDHHGQHDNSHVDMLGDSFVPLGDI